MYDHILVPTDGSDAVEEAAAHAFEQAECHGATVHVLAVADSSEQTARLGRGGEQRQQLLADGEAATHAVAESGGDHGARVVVTVESGEPARTIAEYAREHDVDLIVMSTHARTGIGRFLRGSVTESVLRRADAPVLAVPR